MAAKGQARKGAAKAAKGRKAASSPTVGEALEAVLGKGALAAAKPSKPRKYRNQPCVVDGVRFDSKKEAARWGVLRALEREGSITALETQPEYPLVVNGHAVAAYRGDFRYRDAEGRLVVEDTKSGPTARDRVYRLKKKLVLALYGIEIREV